ncbi:MAG: transcription termination/antitermination protein NusA [Candidatus Pacebacteria bacterium]|nr:transcription termination/antitermination protein NusA [Candidatus Paceibacterota bacterium]
MATPQVARTEFSAAIAQIANERNISIESIHEAIKQALVSAYKKQIGDLEEGFHYYSTLNETSGESQIFKAPVTKIDEETEEVLEWDEKKSEEVTPAGFGRIAAQTAKQVILQKIRESEKDQILSDYQDKIGDLIMGQVLRMDGRMVVLDIGRGQGYMPPEEQMRGEFYKMNMRIAVLISDIRETHKGRRIIVSRADKELVSKLFDREVPEVSSGAVEIVAIAREAGVRTKLAVRAAQEGVDPVGSCVGQRGVRVQEVINELNNEKIDIIPYSDDTRLYMQAALAPAEGLRIEINEDKKEVTVTSPDDQLSLAIGKGGQNVRIASKLTGYKITVKSAEGKVESKVTGEEEYEIDTFEGLEAETREKLVQFKLTTLGDLSRFKAKWQAFEDISDEQKACLNEKVEVFEAEFAKRQAEFPRLDQQA